MQIDKEIRIALIAYTAAHLSWKDEPEGVLVDQDDPAKGTTKVDAKRLRGKLHGKLIELGRLAAVQTKEN